MFFFSVNIQRRASVRLLFLLVTLLVIQGRIAAQKENYPPETLVIDNQTEDIIPFCLRNKYTSKLECVELRPVKIGTYPKKNHIQFVNPGGVITTERDLAFGIRYMVFWNEQTRWWDVRLP